MSTGYRRKHCGDFFAAGAEFQRALETLGDGAFKLYAWTCLHADRVSGRLVFERATLAQRLGRSRSALGRHLRELVQAGVCDLETAPNQHRGSVLAVRAAYWPYQQATDPLAPANSEADVTTYLETVRTTFLGPACVQADFGPADERLARDWHAAGVPLTSVRHAILLGCVRKSMSLLDRADGQPVRSLRYFEPVLREVQRERFPDSYWRHLEFNLARCEDDWRRQADPASGGARPNLGQAGAGADLLRGPQQQQGERG